MLERVEVWVAIAVGGLNVVAVVGTGVAVVMGMARHEGAHQERHRQIDADMQAFNHTVGELRELLVEMGKTDARQEQRLIDIERRLADLERHRGSGILRKV